MPPELGPTYEERKEEFYYEVMRAIDPANTLVDGLGSGHYKALVEGMIAEKLSKGQVKVRREAIPGKVKEAMDNFEGRFGAREKVMSIVEEIIAEKRLEGQKATDFKAKVEAMLNLVSFDIQE